MHQVPLSKACRQGSTGLDIDRFWPRYSHHQTGPVCTWGEKLVIIYAFPRCGGIFHKRRITSCIHARHCRETRNTNGFSSSFWLVLGLLAVVIVAVCCVGIGFIVRCWFAHSRFSISSDLRVACSKSEIISLYLSLFSGLSWDCSLTISASLSTISASPCFSINPPSRILRVCTITPFLVA